MEKYSSAGVFVVVVIKLLKIPAELVMAVRAGCAGIDLLPVIFKLAVFFSDWFK